MMTDLEYLSSFLPRVRRLKGKRLLIKFGGNSMEAEGDRDRFVREIALLISLGLKLVIVHGGGPSISKEMEARGLNVKKVAGLRITDDAALEVAKEVLCDINERMVSALRIAGLKAIGMPGGEEGIVLCSKLDPVEVLEEGKSLRVDLGNVGQVKLIDPTKIILLCASGFVPVIYPICRNEHGNEMNVNADTVAAHLAKALGCEEMVMVTDVPGLMRQNGDGSTLISQLSVAQVDELMNEGVITEGMVPKLEACKLAITSGVKRVHVVSGEEPNSILRQVLSGVSCGTTVIDN